MDYAGPFGGLQRQFFGNAHVLTNLLYQFQNLKLSRLGFKVKGLELKV